MSLKTSSNNPLSYPMDLHVLNTTVVCLDGNAWCPSHHVRTDGTNSGVPSIGLYADEL